MGTGAILPKAGASRQYVALFNRVFADTVRHRHLWQCGHLEI